VREIVLVVRVALMFRWVVGVVERREVRRHWWRRRKCRDAGVAGFASHQRRRLWGKAGRSWRWTRAFRVRSSVGGRWRKRSRRIARLDGADDAATATPATPVRTRQRRKLDVARGEWSGVGRDVCWRSAAAKVV